MADQVLMPNQTTHGHPRNGFRKNFGCIFFFIVVLTPSCCAPINVLPYYLKYIFPANNLNFDWRWRWWDRIQAIFLNIFYFMFSWLGRLIYIEGITRVIVNIDKIVHNKILAHKIKICWFCRSFSPWRFRRSVDGLSSKIEWWVKQIISIWLLGKTLAARGIISKVPKQYLENPNLLSETL